MLEVGRQRQSFTKVVGRLVGREARPDRGDLEQHAARLAEVDRLEVEAVDDRRYVRASGGDPLAPGLVLVQRRRPGDVVHRAGAADARVLRRLVVLVETASVRTARLPRVAVARVEL